MNDICTKGKIFLIEGCELFSNQVEEEDLDVVPDCNFEELDKGCHEISEISLHAHYRIS